MPQMEPQDDSFVRPFADWLREQSNGKTHEEMGDGIHTLVARVLETGKAGTLTLTIKVKPMEDSEDSPLLITDEIKLRLPEHDRKASIFYADKLGNLTKQDPNQLSFESLREVAGVGTVDVETGEVREA